MSSFDTHKNLIKSTAEYNRVLEDFGGVDFTSNDSECEIKRFPYLVNMWRDWESENGAALETVPGYRRLPKGFDASTEDKRINGLYSTVFSVDGIAREYVLVHSGKHLFAFPHDERDLPLSYAPIATLSSGHSSGFEYGGIFYILDGENIYKVSSPDSVTLLGDGEYTEEMEETGILPTTDAYIPTAFFNGEEYEQRNMLTNYYYSKHEGSSAREAFDNYGLKYRKIADGDGVALEVYGFEGEREAVFVPSSATVGGVSYPVIRIAASVFKQTNIKTAFISESVKEIAGGEESGAFYGCQSLKTVVLASVEAVGTDTFAFCSSLEKLIIGKKIVTLAQSALRGCDKLKTVGFEGEAWDSSIYEFSEEVEILPDAVIITASVGDTLKIPCDTDTYKSVYLTDNNESSALSMPSAYSGFYSESGESLTGFEVKVKGRCSLSGFVMKSSNAVFKSRIAVIASLDGELVFSEKEESLASFYFDIPDFCKEIAEVKLDGETVPYKSSSPSRLAYSIERSYQDSVSCVVSITLTLERKRISGGLLTVKCYGHDGKYSARSYPDYSSENAFYKGSSISAIRKCRIAAVFDGRIFLSGNPELPNTVFYSEVDSNHRSSPDYFGSLDFFNCGSSLSENTALLSTPAYLAVMKKERGSDGGIYFFKPESEKSKLRPKAYTLSEGCAERGSLGQAVSFGGEAVFLSKEGLFAIGDKNAFSERKTEKRSVFIERKLLFDSSLENSRLAKWKGYLVLLSGGVIYLADSRQASKLDGVKQYEWYYLEDIGDYEGATPKYKHMSVFPKGLSEFSKTPVAEGLCPEVLGREEYFEGEVKEALLTSEETGSVVKIFYTVISDSSGKGHLYLLDSTGELTGGEFKPATELLSLDGVLYFGTENGKLFAFNTDKRGEGVLVGDSLEEVRPDEIHSSFYSFAGRGYKSGFITKKDDCGVGHLAKTTARRSLSVKCKLMENSSFTLGVKTERSLWESVVSVTGSPLNFARLDFSSHSFDTGEEYIFLTGEHKRSWVEKQFSLFSNKYMSPFGIYRIAYRYKLSGRHSAF